MHKEAKDFLHKYEKAKTHRENFVPLFEECYEYSMPQRESFYTESVGQRRDEKIFDETAVVGVQEFASRLTLLGGLTLLLVLKYPKNKEKKLIMILMKLLTMCLRYYKTLTLVKRCMNRLWIWQ